jgi:nucleotide-binding universal stress UspA family protein
MFDNVIAALNDGPAALDAIALATDLIDAGGTLALAHVTRGDPQPHRVSRATSQASQRLVSLELIEAAAVRADVTATPLTSVARSVGRGLHELAEREHCDLLVVGSSGRAFFDRVVIGDDTRDALNGAPCAVAIAPSGYARHAAQLREIGVAYDGSPESEDALATARALAAARSARVSAFEAVNIPAGLLGAYGVEFGDAIDAIVQTAHERIDALGGVEAHAAYGPVIEELALYSASVDLLVIGSRGYGPLGRLVHGSTSTGLARSARCPLLVLPRGSLAVPGEIPAVSAAALAT